MGVIDDDLADSFENILEEESQGEPEPQPEPEPVNKPEPQSDDDEPVFDGGGDDDYDSGKSELKASTIEDLARAEGWKSKEELEKAGKYDPDKYRDAAEFIKYGLDRTKDIRKEFKSELDKINERHAQEAERTRKQLDELLSQNKTAEQKRIEAEAKAELAELRQQRREAIENNDVDVVEELDDKIFELRLKAQGKGDPATTTTTQTNSNSPAKSPEVQAWLDENPWYQENHADYDADLNALVDGVFQREQGGGKTFYQTFKAIDAAVAKYRERMAPDSGADPEGVKHPTKVGGGRRSGSQPKGDSDDLTRAEKAMARELDMSEADYKKYKKTNVEFE